jgi:sensor domain CHASE-containing protein
MCRPDHPELASTENNLGSVYASMGDFVTAHAMWTDALRIIKATVGLTHPNAQAIQNNLAKIANA